MSGSMLQNFDTMRFHLAVLLYERILPHSKTRTIVSHLNCACYIMIGTARSRIDTECWNTWPRNLERGMGLIWLGHVVMDIFHGVSCGSDISVVTLIGLDRFARFVTRKGDTRTGAPDMFPCFLLYIVIAFLGPFSEFCVARGSSWNRGNKRAHQGPESMWNPCE